MKTKMFSIYDAKAESYVTPWFQPTFGLAERIFTDEVNNPESTLNKHPEDYTLFYLGEMDQDTGKIETEATPKPLAKALEVNNQIN